MGVEIVQRQMNCECGRPHLLRQVFDERGKTRPGRPDPDLNGAALALGSTAAKMLRAPARLALSGAPVRLKSDWRAGLPGQLSALHIPADHRLL